MKPRTRIDVSQRAHPCQWRFIRSPHQQHKYQEVVLFGIVVLPCLVFLHIVMMYLFGEHSSLTLYLSLLPHQTSQYLDQKNGHLLPTARGLEKHSSFAKKKSCIIKHLFFVEFLLRKQLCHLNCAHFCLGDRSTASLLAQHCFWSSAEKEQDKDA